jgi:hypothetical protein
LLPLVPQKPFTTAVTAFLLAGGIGLAAFLVSFDVKHLRVSRDLDAMMEKLDAVRIGEHLWGLELDIDPNTVHDWLKSNLACSDTAIVIQLRPLLEQSSTNISANAKIWLERVLHPATS